MPFCDGFTPRLADRRGLAPSALEPISDPETISEAVWIADAVLAFEAAILVNYMGIEALQNLQLFISQDVRANYMGIEALQTLQLFIKTSELNEL